MLSTRFNRSAAALLAALGFAWAATAQEPSKDDALDRLLEEVVGPESGPADKPKADDEKAGEKAEPSKDASKADDKAKEEPNKSEPNADDEALDKLLQGIGETSDTPDATGRPAAPKPGEEGDTPPANGEPEDVAGKKFDPKQEKLDARLEEILGRIKKKDQPPQESSGALAQAIKKMDDVEKKLGEKNTGEKTREEQQQIIEELKQLIKQAQQGGGSGRGRVREIRQAGQRPGQQPGQQAGNTGTGVGPMKPKKPDAKSILAQNKDEWGHLPPELRGEMENVFKEEALPARKMLIDRYYLSISKKSLSRER